MAEEVQRGLIPHALQVAGVNNADGCTFRAPATKKTRTFNPCGTENNRVPIGTRFALNVTDAEIDAHLDSLPSDIPQAMKDNLRVIAVALRDYGWFVSDHGSGYVKFRMEHTYSASAIWEALEMDDRIASDGKHYPREGLNDLFTAARMYAVAPSDEYILADAGSSQAVVAGEAVFLDGAASHDANGDALEYAWAITSKPAGSAAGLDDPNAVNPTFIADLPGTYQVRLVVSDGTHESEPDVVNVEAVTSIENGGVIIPH